ncbi:FMN-binding negative transcriptional regulator [Mycobacteroides abscessus]|uniref:FMN-binding negative transcriptional regulator n=1 Tax=Mycobacteroides abscessus TaxID=36809 RepID=UPI00078BD735|nr:FMN-binding negative transcriptional regulator [Mycobacteroides abscessus]AMU23386.1 transcriptional regulator [Mycobacteroides abscessus]UEA48410.1 FMN-binding negative transcriptional regulator [Mycobacteroides abscessus subsp. abscessus]UEA51609.1 FMN-binding negative transcriptional regulator [Mycobacteroides abscessus]SIA31580.1 Putative transcriptional regulator [Mycobacteroides abscessus subsp. bolletii]SIA78158.1 Putative transcriptional regulator [Mycobacteroides abscessus subsp. b
MYVPKNFAMQAKEVTAVLGDAGLAHLVTHDDAGYLVTPVPLLYRPTSNTLVGHVSRANPHWHRTGPSIAIFAGPQGYISPSLYATKAETGKVVPTWNYEVLNVHGHLTAHDNPEWVRALVTELTDRHEHHRDSPWGIDDAPEEFTSAQIRAIVGIELSIESVEGKAKMSQNQPERNRTGVIEGLRRSGDPAQQQVAERVAAQNYTR